VNIGIIRAEKEAGRNRRGRVGRVFVQISETPALVGLFAQPKLIRGRDPLAVVSPRTKPDQPDHDRVFHGKSRGFCGRVGLERGKNPTTNPTSNPTILSPQSGGLGVDGPAWSGFVVGLVVGFWPTRGQTRPATRPSRCGW
jgi:hypothetical protein